MANNYPRWLTLEPVGDWPGELKGTRKSAQFASTLATTARELAAELDKLKARNPRLRVAVTREQLYLDGSAIRAGERPFHPGVVLVFDTPEGQMTFPCDTYTRWEDNLRAITKTLEALRAIDRWGVTTGQQYGGFLAIEAARSMPAGFSSFEEAWRYLEEVAGLPKDVYEPPESRLPRLVRAALRRTHPDMGGDPAEFRRVTLAEQFIKQQSGAA